MTAASEKTWMFIAVSLLVVLLSLALCAPSQAFASLAVGANPNAESVGTKISTAAAKSAGYRMAVAGAKISYSRLTLNKDGVGTRAYFKACKTLSKSGYYVKNQKQMQCNVPVAAAVRTSGVDKKFPTTCAGMYNCMKKSKQWKYLGHYNGKISSLKPGDILVRVKGVTTYTQNGVKVKAAGNHICMYVGKNIAKMVYAKYLKGTDADKGNPGSSRVFVNARQAPNDLPQRRAACLEMGRTASADSRMLVFRHR